jgi:glycosidase
MPTSVFSPQLTQALQQARAAAQLAATKQVTVNGTVKTIPYPFPSPEDWRDCWIYFLMTDRFNNPSAPPNSVAAAPPADWDQIYNFRQGGTFKGIEQQLDYIASLGAGAIWLSPVLKNASPVPDWAWNYHGYATQDFLTVDGRFASDGTSATAALELAQLIESAHARGLYVVIDIVINHAARVFDYVINGAVTDSFTDQSILYGPLGDEPPIEWLSGAGLPQAAWTNTLPPPAALSPNDAVWPQDLQRDDFFRRRGNKVSDTAVDGGFAKGDFGTMRQLVVEYALAQNDQSALRHQYGQNPVLSILVLAYQYLIAQFDCDGFRIDTVKYVDPVMVETFGNAIREFALSMGKKNFFTFGEIYDDEATIEDFVGRNNSGTDGYGIDAALDFPLFFILPAIAKGMGDVAALRDVFIARKEAEKGVLSSHGEAGKFFVTFLDNHDQNQRFNYPGTPSMQITIGLAVLFCLQGIPCIYYGTEQGLTGAKDNNGQPDLTALESVREALWGKTNAFDSTAFFYQQVQLFSALRAKEPALRYGRLYFREVSGNKQDFGYSSGQGGILAFSRILNDREVLLVANTNTASPFSGYILADSDLNRLINTMSITYSNAGTAGLAPLGITPQASFYDGTTLTGAGYATWVYVTLTPMEVQVLTPAS